MSTRQSIFVFGLVVALCAASGCTKIVPPLPDKNTNWLKACDEDAECGDELACLCGACTKACTKSEQCGEVAPDAACIAAGDPAVQAACAGQFPAPAICSAVCKADDDCDAHASGLACRNGLCAPRSMEIPEADEATCKPGDVIAKICPIECPGLNHTAFATCAADRHYGPCVCEDPKCGPATDCAGGYTCRGFTCIEAANRCGDTTCARGETCLDDTCVQILADGLSSPGDFAIAADENLYFVETGTYDDSGQFNFDAALMRVPADGGTVRRVAEDLNEIGRMLIVGSDAYWFSRRDAVSFQVMGARVPNGTPNALFSTNNAQSALVADDDALYWLERKEPDGPVDLMRVPRDSSEAPSIVIQLPEPANALLLAGNRFFWGGTTTGLWTAAIDGNNVERVVEPTESAAGPSEFVFDGNLYWSWTREPNFGISAYPNPLAPVSNVVNPTLGQLWGAPVSNGAKLYWVQSDANGEFAVAETNLPPGGPSHVLWRSPQLRAASRLAVHGSFLYASVRDKIVRIRVLWDL